MCTLKFGKQIGDGGPLSASCFTSAAKSGPGDIISQSLVASFVVSKRELH